MNKLTPWRKTGPDEGWMVYMEWPEVMQLMIFPVAHPEFPNQPKG